MGLKYYYHLAFQIRKIEVTLEYELTPTIQSTKSNNILSRLSSQGPLFLEGLLEAKMTSLLIRKNLLKYSFGVDVKVPKKSFVRTCSMFIQFRFIVSQLGTNFLKFLKILKTESF